MRREINATLLLLLIALCFIAAAYVEGSTIGYPPEANVVKVCSDE